MPGPTDAVLEIVVVTYWSRALVEGCLESLRRHPLTLGPTTVHLVDNASGDGTVEMVRESFPEVRVQALEANFGFSFANNLVLRQASAPFVLLLNPDAEVCEGVLDHLVETMLSRPEVGMTGCRLVQADGSFDHAAKRSFPTPLAALAHFTGVGRAAGASGRLAQYRAPGVEEHGVGEVDAVNGAFMLCRCEAIEQVGLLDEGYWLYMEDLDWCYRFHQAGWKVLYDGRVTALHLKGASSGVRRALRQDVAFHRGMGRFYRKFRAGRRPLGDVAVYAGIGAKLGTSIFAGALARARGAG